MTEPVPTSRSCCPAHNEADNIAPMTAALQARPESRSAAIEIVFVDDGSRDGTLAAIRAAAARQAGDALSSRSPAISVTRRRCAPGLRHARGRAVIVMDADFEHPPELIPELVAAWQATAPRWWRRGARNATPDCRL